MTAPWDAARAASRRTTRTYKPVGPMAGGPPPGWVQRIGVAAPVPPPAKPATPAMPTLPNPHNQTCGNQWLNDPRMLCEKPAGHDGKHECTLQAVTGVVTRYQWARRQALKAFEEPESS